MLQQQRIGKIEKFSRFSLARPIGCCAPSLPGKHGSQDHQAAVYALIALPTERVVHLSFWSAHLFGLFSFFRPVPCQPVLVWL